MLDTSKLEIALSSRGASILTAACGVEFHTGELLKGLKGEIEADPQHTATFLKAFFAKASSGECRYVASMLAALGCSNALLVPVGDKRIADQIDSYGLDHDLIEEVVSAWMAGWY